MARYDEVLEMPHLKAKEWRARPARGSAKPYQREGVRVLQGRIVYTKKRKNGCRLVSSADIKRAAAMPSKLKPFTPPQQRQIEFRPEPPKLMTVAGSFVKRKLAKVPKHLRKPQQSGKIQIGTRKDERGRIVPVFKDA